MSKGSSLPDVALREIERLSRKDSQMGARPTSPRPLPVSQKGQIGARPSSSRPLPATTAQTSRPTGKSPTSGKEKP